MRWRCGVAGLLAGVVVAGCGGEAPPTACPGTSARPAATVPPVGGSGRGALAWKVTLGTCTGASPASALAVGGGVAYVVAGGALRALDIGGGRQRWRAALPAPAAGERQQWEVGRVGGAVVVIESGRRRRAVNEYRLTLASFDAATGRPLVQRVLQDWQPRGGRAWFLTPGRRFAPAEGAVMSDDAGHISLLDPGTGDARWTATLPPPSGLGWELLGAGGVIYAWQSAPAPSGAVQRIDLASGRVLPPLPLPAGAAGATPAAAIGDLLLLDGPQGAFAVRPADGGVAWSIPAAGAPGDHLSQYDTVLGGIDGESRLSVATRRDGGGFGVYDLDIGAWRGRRPGDWKHETPFRAPRDGGLTVLHADGAAWLDARDAAGRTRWRSPAVPDWELLATARAGGMVMSFACTRLPGHGCASYDLLAVRV